MDDPKNRFNDHHDHLGVNKLGKNIRKVPTHHHQPPQPPQQPQPLVYNISKTDFRSFVQQLTGFGSTSTVNPLQKNPPKPPNSRLVKVRPAPLTQINRPPPPLAPNNSTSVQPVQIGPPSPKPVLPVIPGNPILANVAESPISAYIRYLTEPSPMPNHSHPQDQPPNQNSVQPSSGSLPLHQTNPTFLPSPTSQFLLSSSRSPFPLLSPNFAFSPAFLGGGPQPPASPGLYFPLSPSGIFQILSPR